MRLNCERFERWLNRNESLMRKVKKNGKSSFRRHYEQSKKERMNANMKLNLEPRKREHLISKGNQLS